MNMYLELYATALSELGYKIYYVADLEDTFEIYLRSNLPILKPLELDFPTQMLKKWSSKWFLSVLLNKFRRVVKFLSRNSSHVDFSVLTRLLEEKNKVGFKPDLVMCMYLDMTHLGRFSRRTFRKLNIPWTGLLFHPPTLSRSNRFKRNSWFSDYSNRGGIFFTPAKIESYSAASRPNQSFDVFPDVTRRPKSAIRPAGFNFPNFADRRLVVGLIGSIDGNKKLVEEFLALSDDSRLNNFCFVMVGEIYESTLSKDALNAIRARKGVSKNLFIDDRYIDSEEEFDYLFRQVDIIFACYKNFDSSANVLAKSAYFRKPVLVTANTFIGNLTQQYNLGITIKNPEVDSIAKSILILGKALKSQDFDFGFADYVARVSPENLKNRLDGYLQNLWKL
jgi:glycosyltransferase involved in cell wall biosynthesis